MLDQHVVPGGQRSGMTIGTTVTGLGKILTRDRVIVGIVSVSMRVKIGEMTSAALTAARMTGGRALQGTINIVALHA